MSGRGPRLFSLPTRIGTLPVRSTIKLNVASTPWEFLIVHQGLPSDIYDASCDGAWLFMKDIYENRAWNSTQSSAYAPSTINTWLNGDFLGLFDPKIQNAIKQVKIPYANGAGKSEIASGSSGLSVKIFLLSATEVHGDDQYVVKNEGSTLAYFYGNYVTKRIAYLDGTAAYWWNRSPYIRNNVRTRASYVDTDGTMGGANCTGSLGIRPAFILPSDFIVTDDMIA